MTIHRQLLRDYASRDRLNPRTNPKRNADEWPTLVQLAQGIVCIGLVLGMLFLLWQLTTPAGIAEMANVGAYVKYLLTGG